MTHLEGAVEKGLGKEAKKGKKKLKRSKDSYHTDLFHETCFSDLNFRLLSTRGDIRLVVVIAMPRGDKALL